MLSVLPLVLSLALAAPPASPSTPKGPPTASAVAVSTPSWIKPSQQSSNLINIDFPGGTLAEFYRGLSATPQGKALKPVVVNERADRVRMQPVAMSDVDVLTLYTLATQLVTGVALNPLTSSTEGGHPTLSAYVLMIEPGAESAQAPRPAMFSLDFPGGTVRDYAHAIRKACASANIVVLGNAGDSLLAPMMLRDVTVEAAVRALEGPQENTTGAPTARFVRGVSIAGTPESVFSIQEETKRTGPDESAHVRVWSLAPALTTGVRLEDLLSAIEAALAVDGRPSKLNYHEATSLLIVRAVETQHQLVDSVIHEVEYSNQVNEGEKGGSSQ